MDNITFSVAEDLNNIRAVDINKGDVVYFPIDMFGKRKPDLGRIYYIGKYGKFEPAIMHFTEHTNIEFQLIEIVKSKKMWYQFWKRRKVIGCNFKAV